MPFWTSLSPIFCSVCNLHPDSPKRAAPYSAPPRPMSTTSQSTGLGRPIFCPAEEKDYDEKKARLLSFRDPQHLSQFWDSFPPTLLPHAISPATAQLFTPLLPFLVESALEAWTLFPPGQPLTALAAGGTITLTQRQITSLLACAFFDLLPDLSTTHSFDGQRLTFIDWVGSPVCPHKWTCLATYFSTMHSEASRNPAWTGTLLSFSRCGLDATTLPTPDAWAALTSTPLSKLRVIEGQPIEAQAEALQADFANQYIGGGVLSWGNVQEEIRFTVSTECLVSMLFCDRMLPHEAVLIRGSRIFSLHSGYGGSFRFAGPAPADDPAATPPVGADGHRDSTLVAFDAVMYHHPEMQYNSTDAVRELRKCLAAMGGPAGWEFEAGAAALRPFATGNWGCGLFNGDPQFKSVLQWMAASAVGGTGGTAGGRDVLYFPYGDRRVAGLERLAGLVVAANAASAARLGPGAPPAISVGVVMRWVLEFERSPQGPESADCAGFFKYMEQAIAALGA